MEDFPLPKLINCSVCSSGNICKDVVGASLDFHQWALEESPHSCSFLLFGIFPVALLRFVFFAFMHCETQTYHWGNDTGQGQSAQELKSRHGILEKLLGFWLPGVVQSTKVLCIFKAGISFSFFSYPARTSWVILVQFIGNANWLPILTTTCST